VLRDSGPTATFTPRDLLTLALSLLRDGVAAETKRRTLGLSPPRAVEAELTRRAQVSYRSAVNRAYYAAFGEATIYADARGLSEDDKKSKGSHLAVRTHLHMLRNTHADPHKGLLKDAADHLEELSAMRQRADYTYDKGTDRGTATRACFLAGEVIVGLDTLP